MTKNLKQMTKEEKVALYDEAMSIRQETGLSAAKIADKLDVAEPTVNNWVYKDVSPHDEFDYRKDDDAGPDLPDKPSDEWIMWFTGFWEGEGSLKVRETNNGGMSADIQVTQTKDRGEKVCEEVRDTFGCGSVSVSRESREDWSTCYVWYTGRKKQALQITEWMMPHLRVRKEEIRDKRQRLLDYIGGAEIWTPTEEKFLADNWKKSAEWVADELGRTKESVEKKRRRLGYYHK